MAQSTILDTTPPVAEGPLFYDYRRLIGTRAFSPPPSAVVKALRTLESIFEGYITDVTRRLLPVTVTFRSQYEGDRYLYSFVNDSEVPVRAYWKDFAELWSTRNPDEYLQIARSLIDQGVLAADSGVEVITIRPGQQATWQFVHDAPPVRINSRAELYGAGRSADMYGLAPLYAPSSFVRVAQ